MTRAEKRNVIIAWAGALIAVAAAVAVTVYDYRNRGEPVVTVSLVETEQASMKAREHAAVQLIRMGALDWQMLCAYTVGKDGGSPDTMKKACTVDYKLGPVRPLTCNGLH